MIHPPTKTQTQHGPRVPGVSILTHFVHRAVVYGIADTHSHKHTLMSAVRFCIQQREAAFHLKFPLCAHWCVCVCVSKISNIF